jgi:hypothetical protein
MSEDFPSFWKTLNGSSEHCFEMVRRRRELAAQSYNSMYFQSLQGRSSVHLAEEMRQILSPAGKHLNPIRKQFLKQK